MSARRAALGFAALLLAGAPACTVIEERASGAGGAGGAAGADAGVSTCEGVTADGECDGTRVTFCSDGSIKTVDCAALDSTCAVTDGRADCVEPERASGCGALTALGTCNGAVLSYCDSSGLSSMPREIDCAAYGQRCDPTGATDGGAICVPQGPCPTGLDEDGACTGNQLSFCEAGEKYTFDCGVDQCDARGGFADCVVVGAADGCGGETAEGRCDASGKRVSCQGNQVATEDCALLGLECRSDGAGSMRCMPPTSCATSCPNGTSCQSGRCAPNQTPSAEWTFMVYVIGDNNLTADAWRDLNEMEVIGSTSAVSVLTEVEFSSTYDYAPQAAYRNAVYRMKVQKDDDSSAVTSLKTAEKVGTFKMSDPARISEFVRWGVEQHPAKRYALIMWNHGAGYKEAFIDDGGSLSLKELVTGVRDSGVHLDLIGFDACYMGMHEVGYAMRGLADVMVASEESEPGGGYPYDAVLSRLTGQPSMNAAGLGSVIVDEYTNDYGGNPYRSYDVTNSAIDLTRMEAFHAQLGSMVGALAQDLPGNRAGARAMADSSDILRFGQSEDADLGTVASTFRGLGSATAAAADDLSASLASSGLVIDSKAIGSVSAATGLAIFLPRPGGGYYEGAGAIEGYKSRVAFLPMQPWIGFASALVDASEPPPPPVGTGAVDQFRVALSWGDSPTSTKSGADLDLYVFEPDGDFGTPANGSTTSNGRLSGDSYDTDLPAESYELNPSHVPGTYIVLVHFYGGPPGEVAYPTLQVFRPDLPGGTRTLLRGKLKDRELVQIPMDDSKPLTQPIDGANFPGVLALDYSNLWYATTIEVK
ncbi:MAG: clostripain-related cysteine peptidase [Polyangiaceae bacterium]|nr:clostripain-related cysteine peptidase [Polyangiaceae bacterium]